MSLPVIVVGGGPAGMMAAIRAAELGEKVVLVEQNAALGAKLLLSGKGRCNITNSCELESFIERFSKNGPFLRDAFKVFFNADLMDYFKSRGVKLKTERQGRVFPISDRASSVLNVLKSELRKKRVDLVFKAKATKILLEKEKVCGLLLKDKRVIKSEGIVLATGGCSYRFTGSDGSGIHISKEMGHPVVETRPALVPLTVKGEYPKLLEGLTLKNIKLRFRAGKKLLESPIGELLFTGEGISGPLVLSCSGRVVDWIFGNKEVFVEIDLKPALSSDQVMQRLLRELKLGSRKSLANILKCMLPLRLIPIFLDQTKIDPDKRGHQVTGHQRAAIGSLLKAFRLTITGSAGFDKAMVTSGGVSLKSIDPRTMASRSKIGLFFCW